MMGLKSYWQGSLKTMEVLNSPHAGINGLVASFVSLLQVRRGFALLLNISFSIGLRSQSRKNDL